MAPKDTKEKELTDYYQTERNGVTFKSSFVAVIVNYLVEADVDVEEIKGASEEVCLATINEAWMATHETDLPKIRLASVKTWLGVSSSSVTSNEGVDDKIDTHVDATEEELDLFGKGGPSSRELAALRREAKNQNMSGKRMLRLSLALELGRVPAMGEVIGTVFWGSDARIADAVKQQRKAGVPTLSVILAGKNPRYAVSMHIVSLTRAYSEMNSMEEASRLTQLLNDATEVSHEEGVFVQYLQELLKKYPGMGIPVTSDVLIAQRIVGSRAVGGVSSEQFKELKELVKTVKADAEQARRESSTLKAELGRVKAGKGNPTPGKAGAEQRVCHYCGEQGHIARFCPNKPKKGEEESEPPPTE